MSVSCDFAEIAVITRGDKKLELPSQVAVRYCKYRSKQGWRVENRECLARRQIIQRLLARLSLLAFRAAFANSSARSSTGGGAVCSGVRNNLEPGSDTLDDSMAIGMQSKRPISTG